MVAAAGRLRCTTPTSRTQSASTTTRARSPPQVRVQAEPKMAGPPQVEDQGPRTAHVRRGPCVARARAGSPYTYFHRPLPGYPPGFPVLLENVLTAQRAIASAQYLIDSNYLDPEVRLRATFGGGGQRAPGLCHEAHGLQRQSQQYASTSSSLSFSHVAPVVVLSPVRCADQLDERRAHVVQPGPARVWLHAPGLWLAGGRQRQRPGAVPGAARA